MTRIHFKSPDGEEKHHFDTGFTDDTDSLLVACGEGNNNLASIQYFAFNFNALAEVDQQPDFNT